MRKLIQEPKEVLRKNAIEATENLIQAIKKEIGSFIECWVFEKCGAFVGWINEAECTDVECVYGESDGMYLFLAGGKVAVFLPKITETYLSFFESINQYYEEDDSMFLETVPDLVDIWYDGKTISVSLFSNLAGLKLEAYESAKKVANEVLKMLSESSCRDSFEYVELDRYGEEGFEEGCTEDYFVGIKFKFEPRM